MDKDRPFLQDRALSLVFALRGFFLLLKSERAVQIHFALALIFILIAWLTDKSLLLIALQLVIFGVILSIEALNTAIERMCDFVHPDFNHKIGFIKDISAGAVAFAVIFGYAAIGCIYLI